MWLLALAVVAFLLARAGADRQNLRALTLQTRALTLQTRHDAGVSITALCTLRSDLQQRVDSAEAFLLDHPKGIPGVPVRTIRDGIANQNRTIAALSGLSCP